MATTQATVKDFMEQINAEDFEEAHCSALLERADAYIGEFINNDDELSPRKQLIYDQAVLETATNFYLNRDGSSKGVSRSYSGLNFLLDTLRTPTLAWSE